MIGPNSPGITVAGQAKIVNMDDMIKFLEENKNKWFLTDVWWVQFRRYTITKMLFPSGKPAEINGYTGMA